MILAANRSGKTLACGFEASFHANGRYPEWWEGFRFKKPTLGWAAGQSNETTRDVVQKMLMGDSEEEWGTGAVPKSDIVKVDKARGIAGAVDKVYVRHVSGGVSIIQFKSYEQGWEKWTGADVDWGWPDEEPPELIYKELLTRMNNTRGILFCSLTPLKGMTKVVSYFFPAPNTRDRHLTMMTIDDALHFDDAQRAQQILQYEPYEREARLKGIPMLGSGRVFPIPAERIQVDPFEIPGAWPSLVGMDFGWDHPTAAAKISWDRQNDCLYLSKEYRVSEEIPVVHARSIKAWGGWLPVAWPHDGFIHDKVSGVTLSDEYRKEGLRMWREHSTFERGGLGLEAGVLEMLDRMRTERFKVFTSCPMFIEEFNVYHRKDGKIVRVKDDILSAARMAMMMKRIARTETRRMSKGRPADWSPLAAYN